MSSTDSKNSYKKRSKESSENRIRNQYAKDSSISERKSENSSISSKRSNSTLKNYKDSKYSDENVIEIDDIFINKVKKYKELQHKKKIIADANKKNNQDINLLKESIMDYMKSKGFNEVFHKNGKLKLTTSKRTSAITKDILRDSFTEYLKSEKKLMNYLI